MHKKYIDASRHGKIGAIDLAVAKLNSSQVKDQDTFIDIMIRREDPSVDENLKKL
jgi:hypothetical protein